MKSFLRAVVLFLSVSIVNSTKPMEDVVWLGVVVGVAATVPTVALYFVAGKDNVQTRVKRSCSVLAQAAFLGGLGGVMGSTLPCTVIPVECNAANMVTGAFVTSGTFAAVGTLAAIRDKYIH